MTSVSCRSQLPWSTLEFQFRDDKQKPFFSVRNGIRFPAKASLRFRLAVSFGARFPSVFPIIRCSSDDSAATDSDTSPPSIFIKGFPRSTSETRLKKAFSEFGRVRQEQCMRQGCGYIYGIRDVKILTDKETGESLGAAYIWMNKAEYAELAIKQMNGAFFDGKFISLTIPKGSFKREKKERNVEF